MSLAHPVNLQAAATMCGGARYPSLINNCSPRRDQTRSGRPHRRSLRRWRRAARAAAALPLLASWRLPRRRWRRRQTAAVVETGATRETSRVAMTSDDRLTAYSGEYVLVTPMHSPFASVSLRTISRCSPHRETAPRQIAPCTLRPGFVLWHDVPCVGIVVQNRCAHVLALSCERGRMAAAHKGGGAVRTPIFLVKLNST